MATPPAPPPAGPPPPPPPPPPPAPPVWVATDIGSLDATTAWAFAINDSGTIVGVLSGFQDHGGTLPFVYAHGAMQKLPGASFGDEARVINNAGAIAGIANSGGVIIWDAATAAPHLEVTGIDAAKLSSLTDVVMGINASGDVLYSPADLSHNNGAAFRWHSGAFQNIGGLQSNNGHQAIAAAINDAGQIVGSSEIRRFAGESEPVYQNHAFLWQDGVIRDLGVLKAFSCRDISGNMVDCAVSEATDINASGTVVGNATGGPPWLRAFVWQNGEMKDLGAFPGMVTRAIAINDRGQVLATADSLTFVWDAGAVRTVGTNLLATALGAAGEVIGEMRISDTTHAFFWQDGQLTDLGPGSARALNARDDVIGARGNRAILWQKTTPTQH